MKSLYEPDEAFATLEEMDRDDTVHHEAGCPDPRDCADVVNVCACCGKYVCPDHSPESVRCVEVGDHHLECELSCPFCINARALDWADERTSA